MYASLAGLASRKLATFKDRLKHVRKGTQLWLSIAQTNETKLRRQRKGEPFTTKARVHCHQFAGLIAQARCWESRHIHHTLCGHGGERWIDGAPVDGSARPNTKTVFK